MPRNYELYARILRLVTTYWADCVRSGRGPALHAVTADVIATDPGLVWG